MKPLPGDTITYRLRPSEQPLNPLRLWHGIVEIAWTDCCRVRLTDEGYLGERELVVYWQIVEVTHGVRG
jgi:hypothetical protein